MFMVMKLKKGDTVRVMIGKDRGKTGKVLRVVPYAQRLMVEGVALQKRHRRPRKQNEKGQRVEVPALIATANVRLVCPSCNKPTRVGFQHSDNVKHRVCKKCGATIS